MLWTEVMKRRRKSSSVDIKRSQKQGGEAVTVYLVAIKLRKSCVSVFHYFGAVGVSPETESARQKTKRLLKLIKIFSGVIKKYLTKSCEKLMKFSGP